KTPVVSMINVSEGPTEFKFSKLMKNVRVIAWILRFQKNCLSKSEDKVHGGLAFEEIKTAEMKLWKIVQRSAFSMVGGMIGGVSVVEERGLFKVKTKLTNRQDTPNFRFPILLPSAHQLVEQLIRHVHEKNGHGGIQITMGKLRENFWILQGRKAVKKVIRSCVICRRFSSKPIEPSPCALPENRVKNA